VPPTTLKRRFRGYDREQTDEILGQLVTICDELRTQRDALQESVEELRREQQELKGRTDHEINRLLHELTSSEGRVSELKKEVADLRRESVQSQGEVERLGEELLQARMLQQKHQEERAEQHANLARLELRDRVLVEQLVILKAELQQSHHDSRVLGPGESRLLRLDRIVESVTREARREAEVTLKKAREQAQKIVRSAEKSGRAIEPESSEDLQRHLGEAIWTSSADSDDSLDQ